MDQDAWNQIYADLESDVAAIKKRGGTVSDLEVILGIDRARFAMERGDTDEAIARIQELKRQLRGPDAPHTRSAAPPPGSPSLDRLEALEEKLHAQTRLGSARLEIVGEDEEEIEITRSAARNTKVDKSIKYDDIKDEYLTLWNACQIRPERSAAVRRESDRLLANRNVYEQIEQETSVPWWFIGLLHQMECSYSLTKHLHNGDSLKARTWQVPAGRPKEGSPPFTFAGSAIDALEVDGFAGKTDWPLALALWRMERYNGFGYRRKFGFASPYLWSFTNHFTAGKYVKDGVFDPNAPSKQCGTAATLRDLMQRGLVSFEEKKPDVAAVPAPKPAEPPRPQAEPQPQAPAAAPSPVATAPQAPAVPPSAPAIPPAQPAAPPPAPAQTAPPPPPAPAPVPAAQPTSAPTAVPAPPPVVPLAAVASSPAPSAATPPASPPPATAAPVAPALVLPASPAPAPAPPAAPAAVAPSPTLPAAVPTAPPQAPPSAPAAASNDASPATPAPAGVSSAVAAALAELAKRRS